MSPRAGLDKLEKRKIFCPFTGIRNPDRPARSLVFYLGQNLFESYNEIL